MRLYEKLRREFEDAIEEAGLENKKIGETCEFVSDHGLHFYGTMLGVSFEAGELNLSIQIDGEEKPRTVWHTEAYDEDFPERKEWRLFPDENGRQKGERTIPGALFFKS